MKGRIRSLLYPVQRQLDELKMLMARSHFMHARRIDSHGDLHSEEYKVFSQWGDDGIIQYLISCIPLKERLFVEFGVEDFLESNCRFLMMHNNWSGLIIDGSEDAMKRVRRRDDYWKYDLEAQCHFLTRENINSVLQAGLKHRAPDLVSIDVDGADYWLLEAIELRPAIYIVEYNSVFGPDRSITVPYREDFNRSRAHYSNLYYGASLSALTELANKKGYRLIGSNSAGNNAYFLREDVLGSSGLTESGVNEAYVCSRFRESRSPAGELSLLRADERLNAIIGLPVYNTRSNQMEPL